MRRRIIGNTLFVALSGVLLAIILVGLGIIPFPAKDQNLSSTQTSNPPTSSVGNVIRRENAQPGTEDWKIPASREASTQIQAYASATSVLPGKVLNFYVSTQQEGTQYEINIYRLGWYDGTGGRLMAVQSNLIGHAQGYYNRDQQRLVACKTCLVNLQTGLIEANWQISFALSVPSNWTTGIYLAKLVDVNDMQTYVPFDVKGNNHAAYVAVTPDTTYAAYNQWGGYSLYAAQSPLAGLSRGAKVSFNRPYDDLYGSSQVLFVEAQAIHWFESQGYDIAYISNVDLHENSEQLLQHRAYISLGHDEYWTKEMRDGVEHARDAGIGLAFLGANAAYWQMRFELDSAGNKDRTIVCYKVESRNNDLERDPIYQNDITRVTAQWRDPVLARPENALIGIMSSDFTHQRFGFSWQVSTNVQSLLLDGTGLQPGQSYGCGLVGNEWDQVMNNGATPNGLHILSVSNVVDNNNRSDVSNTSYYIAPSGAMVFATGAIYWTAALDSYRMYNDKLCSGQPTAVPEMQKLMTHVMKELIVHHRGNDL